MESSAESIFSPEEFVYYIACSLVASPDEVKVDVIEGEEEIILELKVAEDDIGKVIGKRGSVVRSLRTILAACGSRERINYSLEILE